jgi:hypothetical protein
MATTVEVGSQKQFLTEIPDEPVLDISSLGESLQLKHRKTVELTHEEAVRLLELPEFAGDRSLNDNHVIFLQRQMEAGTFRWEQVQLITCRFEGREYRMNGQHTAWARLSMPKTGLRTPVSMLKYEAQTDHDMRQLYASIDRNKARTNSNVVISYLAGRQEFIQFNKRIIKALAESLAFWKWEIESQRSLHTPDDRAYLMLTDHYQLCTRVGNFLNSSRMAGVKHLFRRPVIAAMYATFDKAPEVSQTFWQSVADGEMLSKDDARLALRNKLLTSSIAGGGKALSSDMHTTSSEEMFRWCIQSWNYYRQNKVLRSFKVQLSDARSAVRA